MLDKFDLNQLATPQESDTFPRMEVLRREHAMSQRDRLFALIAVAVGLAATVGLWLFSVVIAGGLNLL